MVDRLWVHNIYKLLSWRCLLYLVGLAGWNNMDRTGGGVKSRCAAGLDGQRSGGLCVLPAVLIIYLNYTTFCNILSRGFTL